MFQFFAMSIYSILDSPRITPAVIGKESNSEQYASSACKSDTLEYSKNSGNSSINEV